MMKYTKISIYLAGLAAALSLAGCAADTDLPDTPDAANQLSPGLHISAVGMANPGSHTSRADLEQAETAENEMISNWVLYLVKDNGEIESRNSATGITPYQPADAPGATAGDVPTYHSRALAFANFDPGEEVVKNLADAIGINDLVNTADAYSKFKASSANSIDIHTLLNLNKEDYPGGYIPAGALSSSATPIPMAGFMDIDPANGNSFDIQVVRLMARMEFAFRNVSSHNVTVNSIHISPAYQGNLYMMPDYAGHSSKTDLINPEDTATISFSPANMTITTAQSGEDDYQRCHFYMKESAANSISGKFRIGVNITRDGAMNGEGLTETIYALTNLREIHRNDYVLIPVAITDFVPKFEIRTYPPIGGYPAEIVANEDVYYITLKESGRFEIYPSLLNTDTGETANLRSSGYEISLDYDENNPLFGKLTEEKMLTQAYYVGYLPDAKDIESDEPVMLTFTFTKKGESGAAFSTSRTLYISR